MLSTPQRLFIYLALSLAVGVLGAERFALAAGVRSPRDEHIFACGVVLGLLTMALLLFLAHLTRQVVALLVQSPVRPGRNVGLALIICGTVCVLSALAMQLYESGRDVSGSTTIGFPQSSGSARVTAQLSESSLLTPVITVAVLLAGAALVALGIWSSTGSPGVPDGSLVARRESPPQVSSQATFPAAGGPRHPDGDEPQL
jgi:hypothetical protein